jgi:DNA-binding HxlR family transcriptional regulator
MKRLTPEAVRLPTVAGGRRRQPARGDARGCLVLALPIPENRADDPRRCAVFVWVLFVLRALASRSGYRYHMVRPSIGEGDMNDVVRADLFSEYCPSREVLKHVTSRWGVLLLVALMDGTHRFGELRRKVGGISEKMLAQTLYWLEQDGFVQRIAHPVVPPHVEYRLTPLGEQIGYKLGDLAAWIEGNLDGILAAQRKARIDQEAKSPLDGKSKGLVAE